MDGAIEGVKDRSNPQPSTVWNTLREFLLFTLALSGIYVLSDLYANGQSISKYLLYGAFGGALSVLVGYERKRNQRKLRSRTYLPPGN